MEELVGFIPVIIIAIISAVAKSAKNQQKTQQHPYQQGMNSARPPVSQPAPAARPAAPARPAQPAAQVSMASMLPQTPPQPLQPRVHDHLVPDCDTHDSPAMGSLNFTSTEGKDPCHEEQLPQQRTAMPTANAVRPGVSLDWNGDALVRAFVMQEVLTRPCERRRR